MIRHALTALLLVASAPAMAAGETLIAKLQSLAETGNAKALYHLGMAYQTGAGVAQDHGRALTYFRNAAARGDPLAAYKLGCFYAGQDGVLPVDLDQALHYKLIAADAGYALAQSDLASLYLQRGDVEQARRWMDRAAAQGTTIALAGAAMMYSGRTIVPKDPVLMIAYLALLTNKVGSSDTQREGIAKMISDLPELDRQRAETKIATYHPTPSMLTTEALSGKRAAEILVGH